MKKCKRDDKVVKTICPLSSLFTPNMEHREEEGEGGDIHQRWGGRRYSPEMAREEIFTRDGEGEDIHQRRGGRRYSPE